jgi:hypothetical protein
VAKPRFHIGDDGVGPGSLYTAKGPTAMRTNSRIVTFNRPFRLTGLDEAQPAGSYTVETDEEQLPALLHTGYRRTTTWLTLPSHATKAGATQIISIDPAELDAALAREAPGGWSLSAEANIDDMLAGSVMKQAVRSAGLSLSQFKEQLRDLARRIGRMRP